MIGTESLFHISALVHLAVTIKWSKQIINIKIIAQQAVTFLYAVEFFDFISTNISCKKVIAKFNVRPNLIHSMSAVD